MSVINLPTITLHFTRGLISALETMGYKVPDPARQILQQRTERVTLDNQDRFWQLISDVSDDPLFALKLGLHIQPGHLDVLGYLLMSSGTLGDALAVLENYHPIVGAGSDFQLHLSDVSCRLVYLPRYHPCRDLRVAAVMASLLNMGRILAGPAFQASQLTLQQQGSELLTCEAETLLGCSVQYTATENGLCFPRCMLTLPLSQANPLVSEQMRVLADQALQQLDQSDFSAQVYGLVSRHLSWHREQVADHLNISVRHFSRRLTDEGTSFKRIQEQVRRQIAEAWLQDGKISIGEMAERLGFNDESAFSRAFRRWTGQSPRAFQRSITSV